MSEPKLKPCPFCGKSVLIVHEPLEYEAHHYVYCGECDTSGPSDLGRSGAIAAWNERPLEAMLLEACEKADMVLEYWIEFPNWIVRDLEADKAHDILLAAIRAAKEGTE